MATIANWFVSKAQRQARESGYFQAAKNLRKQGVPIEIARMMLLGEQA